MSFRYEAVYENEIPTRWLLSNPVYIFYCLGSKGNLGTYNLTANTWVVKDIYVPFDLSTARR